MAPEKNKNVGDKSPDYLKHAIPGKTVFIQAERNQQYSPLITILTD